MLTRYVLQGMWRISPWSSVVEVADECGEASNCGWNSDDETSAEDHQDLSQGHFAAEPITPRSPCPILAGKLVVEAPDSAEDLQPVERDTEQMLDVRGNPLYPQATGGSDYSIAIADTEKSVGSIYSIAAVFWPPGLPEKAHPLGDHKGLERGARR